MGDTAMKRTWAKAQQLGLAIQMHFLPHHAPGIEALAREYESVPVILDHVARAGMGTPEQYKRCLQLAKLPRVYMKISGVNYSSKEQAPFRDARPIVMQAYDAFGPERLLWGGLGQTMTEFARAIEIF